MHPRVELVGVPKSSGATPVNLRNINRCSVWLPLAVGPGLANSALAGSACSAIRGRSSRLVA